MFEKTLHLRELAAVQMPVASSQVSRLHLGSQVITPLVTNSVKQGGHWQVCSGGRTDMPFLAASWMHTKHDLIHDKPVSDLGLQAR